MMAIGFKWFIFIVMALLATGSSLVMVTRRNPIHSALWLIVTFFSVAVLYLLLNETFIAVAQVMVYAGAIMMLILFVIMLVHLEHGPEPSRKVSIPKLIGGIITILLFLQIILGVSAFQDVGKKGIYTPEAVLNPGNPQVVGSVLYGKYAFTFEIASILLLVGILGAVALVKRQKDEER
jgi:NADH-quinone oxidoreductase subunit J